MPRCFFRLSVIWRPILIVGSSEVMGSWKTIAIFGPRMSLHLLLGELEEVLVPRRRISPPLTMVLASGLRRMMLLAVTDFARARLPDYGEGLAAPEVEGDAPYGLHLAARRC